MGDRKLPGREKGAREPGLSCCEVPWGLLEGEASSPTSEQTQEVHLEVNLEVEKQSGN